MTIELHRRPACLREAFMLYFRRNRPLIALRVLLGFLAFAILLLSFVLLSLEGLMWGAGLGQILAVYPRFLVNEGYLGALLPVAVMLVLLSPRVLGWIAGALAGRRGADSTLVLSDLRMVLYRPDGQYGVYYYSDVTGVAASRHTITVFLGGNVLLPMPVADLTPEQTDLLIALCSRRIAPPERPLPVPVQPHDGAVWEGSVDLTVPDLASALWASQRSGRTPLTHTYGVLGALFAAAGVWLAVTGDPVTGITLALLGAVVIVLAALAWQYPFWLRRARRLCVHPLVLRGYSGQVWMDENGLSREGPGGLQRWQWSEITDILSWRGGILLYSRRRFAVFLPARCFESQQQLDELAAWVRRTAHLR